MKKKLISILLIIVIILSSLALSITALASSQELFLNQMATTAMSGVDDLEWFWYKPDQSGLYSFLSYNVPKCEAYLMTREIDPDTGKKKITTLDYAAPGNDPDYKKNNHNEFQFCLTYHLEAGTTYYFAVGWYKSTQTSTQFNVMLRCDSYDENAIESIEISNVPDLIAYDNGEPRIDQNSRSYFYYYTSAIIRNSTVTINFTNGKSISQTGATEIAGYKIMYIDNQYYNHWHPNSAPEYTKNTITVQVLDKTATANVNIIIGAQYFVTGRVVNLAGQAVENALITTNGSKKAYTDSDGYFSFYSTTGSKTLAISTATSIDLSVPLIVGSEKLDLTKTPYVLCNCDYVRDGYVNAKDFSFIVHNYSGTELENLKEEFRASINFSKDKY